MTLFTPHNGPFYRYSGHIELIGSKEYYWMPRGHEHDLIYLHQYLRALFGEFFFKVHYGLYINGE